MERLSKRGGPALAGRPEWLRGVPVVYYADGKF